MPDETTHGSGNDAGPKGRRILVVDDEPGMRSLLREFLTDSGYEVYDAADGDVALELLQSNSIDLTILDIFMPTMDGLEVLNEMRSRSLSSKVIAVSGGGATGSSQPTLAWARLLGAADAMEKPVDLDVLLARVQRCLAA